MCDTCNLMMNNSEISKDDLHLRFTNNGSVYIKMCGDYRPLTKYNNCPECGRKVSTLMEKEEH